MNIRQLTECIQLYSNTIKAILQINFNPILEKLVRKTRQNDGVRMLQAVTCDNLLACVFSKWQDNADVEFLVKPCFGYKRAPSYNELQ